MKTLRTPTRIKLSTVSRNRKYWLLLSLPLVAAALLWSSAASASCNFLSILATAGSADGQVLTPRAIAVDPSGNVFVADQNDRVQKFNSSGVFQFKFATGGSSFGSVVAASGVAVNSTTGDIYVTDGFSERTSGIVQKFNSSGVFQSAWGTSGSANGQFLNGAGGVAVDSAGNVYVTDLGNHRIEKFTASGSFISSWGSSGTGNGQFSAPEGIAIDASDNIYIADTGNHRIQKFNTSGTFVTKWGTNGTGDGQFDTPWGVSVDGVGDVYVADTNNNRIQKFSPTGTFLSSCGTSGSGNGEFSGPQDVGADSTGNYYVADTGNDRVQKFGAGGAAPVANAGTDQTVECGGATTSVTLDGTASTAGTGTINSYSWAEGATPLGTGSTLMVSLPKGSHTITLTVTDTGGGSDTDDVVVNIVDTTPPVITCPADVVVNLPLNSTATSVAVNYPAVTATDGCSSSVNVTSSPASGSVFPIGSTTVNASADDGATTPSTCSFKVIVQYNFAGLFQPVDNLPVLNVVQAGRAVPVKFSLSGYKGLGIFAVGSPSSGPIACNSSDPAVDLTETVTAGGSSLSYDPTTDRYMYVWKTEQGWVGTCRQLVVELNDGSTHRANFKFK
ncbi:MAG TPA: PxKF domain-containing protein [Pyrinomonadaceae bacterium]